MLIDFMLHFIAPIGPADSAFWPWPRPAFMTRLRASAASPSAHYELDAYRTLLMSAIHTSADIGLYDHELAVGLRPLALIFLKREVTILLARGESSNAFC